MSDPTSVVQLLPGGNRHGTVSPDDQSAVLDIAALFLMVVGVLAVTIRIAIRFGTTHIPGMDDVFSFLSLLLAVAFTIAVSVAAHNGIGTRMTLLSPSQVEKAQKDFYISTLMYILTVSVAKISVLVFLARLTVTRIHLAVVRATGLVLILWAIGTLFAAAFQCSLPHPWNYISGKCFDGRPFWYTVGSIDIVTDIVMIAVPGWIVWSLQMNFSKKFIVFIAFAFRVLVIVAAIARLAYLGMFLSDKDADPTFDILPYAYCTQCHALFNVIVACIPTLKPFMDRAESGMLAVSLNNRVPGTTYGHNGDYAMQYLSKKSGSGSNKGTNISQGSRNGIRQGASVANGKIWRPDPVDHQTTVTRGHKRDEADSVDSIGSDKMIIRQTRDWNIQFDDDGQQKRSERTTPDQPYDGDLIHAR